MAKTLKLPELGEGISEAKVLSVLVSSGDTIEKDQTVIEVETEKATAEVPSDFAGTVGEIHVKEGDSIKVGQDILSLSAEGAKDAEEAKDEKGAKKSKAKKEAAPSAEESGAEDEEEEDEADEDEAPPKKAVKGKTARRSAAGGASREDEEEEDEAGEERDVDAAGKADRDEEEDDDRGADDRAARRTSPGARRDDGKIVYLGDRESGNGSAAMGVPASPSVRRLARELGVNIGQVPGTGPGGRISADDVKSYTRRLLSERGGSAAAPSAGSRAGDRRAPSLPDFSQWGEVDHEPLSGIRRATGEAMSTAWQQAPMVTQFDRADITELEAFRKRYVERAGKLDAKLTVTAIAVKVAARALRVFPDFNTSLDAANQELVRKHYVNVGVAVDTEGGLLVPVIRDADEKSVMRIATEIAELAEKARSRRISLDALKGGTFSVSNLGGLGTTYFSPIVNWPEVAILGMGRASTEAVHRDGQFVPRLVLPLVVTYDHRVIDGANAARFLRWIAEAMENPLLLSLED